MLIQIDLIANATTFRNRILKIPTIANYLPVFPFKLLFVAQTQDFLSGLPRRVKKLIIPSSTVLIRN
jgi:hypothetical protein